MNINQFVSSRAAELDRFVLFLEQQKDKIPLRLTTPHPIRPASFERVQSASSTRSSLSSINNNNNENHNSRRAVKYSPFRNCGQFLENTSVAFMKTRKPWKVKMTLSDELKEKIIIQKNTTVTVDLTANRKLSLTSSKKRPKLTKNKNDKLQRRLSQLRRRRAKRRISRALAVTKYGYRFIFDRQTGARRCRVYLPCHRLLSRRFKFIDYTSSNNNNNSNETNSISSSLYPVLYHSTVGENDYFLRIPDHSSTSKTFRKVQKAKTTETCAVFDLSYKFMTKSTLATHDSSLSSLSELGSFVKMHFPKVFIKKKTKKFQAEPVGDGICWIGNDNTQAKCSMISITTGLSLLIVMLPTVSKKKTTNTKDDDAEEVLQNNETIKVFVVGTAENVSLYCDPRNVKEQKHKYFDDDDDAVVPQNQNLSSPNTTSSSSPFCLMIEGIDSEEKSKAVVAKHIHKCAINTAIIRFGSPSNKTLVVDLSSSSRSSMNGIDFSERYKFFSKLFRDLVIEMGCVAGGERDL